MAEAKIAPIPPISPSLPDAEYAAEVIKKFGDVEPLKSSDKVFMNLFQLSIPSKLYIGRTQYQTAKSMFNEKPQIQFPAFHLENGQIYSFDGMNENTLLGEFVDLSSITFVEVEDFGKDVNNRRILITILNRWIRSKCKRKRLEFDPRTRSYFFPKKVNDDSPITVSWVPRFKRSTRELTKPMMIDGTVNYWVHRAAEISARKFWGDYFVRITPRFLFSPDGRYLFEGDRADALDRAFRKSIYNRNLNQLYDVLFWHRYVFPEASTHGSLRLDSFYEDMHEQTITVLEQIKTETECKPNVEIEEEVEQLDKIEQPAKPNTLDDFLQGE